MGKAEQAKSVTEDDEWFCTGKECPGPTHSPQQERSVPVTAASQTSLCSPPGSATASLGLIPPHSDEAEEGHSCTEGRPASQETKVIKKMFLKERQSTECC